MPSIQFHHPDLDPNRMFGVEVFACCGKCGGKIDFGSTVNTNRCVGRCQQCNEPAEFPGHTVDSLKKEILKRALAD
jgi:hypothetical protein